MTTAALYDRLIDHYKPEYGRHWLSIPCPSCGHEAEESSRAASSMCETHWKCQSCGAGGSLWNLAERAGIVDSLSKAPERQRERRNEQKRLPAQWTRNPHAYLDRFLEHPERLQRWQSYKALSLEAISRYRLGYGVLPASKCQHPRLIVPLFSGNQIVGFRGRQDRCTCEVKPGKPLKWTSSGGSSPMCVGLDEINPGDRVGLIESEVDRILCHEHDATVKMLALPFGVASWQAEWTAELVRRRPAHVRIILDNDLAGNPNDDAYEYGVRQWRAKMQRMVDDGKIKAIPAHPPYPNGWKYLQQFQDAGLNADRFIWPAGTPYKADIGDSFT